MNAYQKNAQEVLDALGVDAKSGLTGGQIEQSREKYGPNVFSRNKPKSWLRRFWEACCEPMVLLLVFAAVIALGVNIARYAVGGEGDLLECLGIFIAIFLSVFITVAMEGKSAKAFEALSKFSEDTQVRVLRDGYPQMISQRDVVVGDIIYIETGDTLSPD